MSRGVVGAAAGAGAATLYYKPEILRDAVRDAALGGLRGSSGGTAGADPALGRELENLQQLVAQLSRDVQSSKQGGVTVVHTGGGGGASRTGLALAAAAGAGLLLYVTLGRGWSLVDCMYATRRGLRQGLAQVGSGIDQLGARLEAARAKLAARIAELARRQEQALAGQEELKAQLGAVGADVELTRGQVGQIHGLVLDVEAGMAELSVNQRHANHGIFILCKAVSELMAGSSIPSKAELIEYTQQHPVWAASGGERLQGLEGLLRGPSSGGGVEDPPPEQRRGPFLLATGAAGQGVLPAAAVVTYPMTPVGGAGMCGPGGW